MKLVFRDPSVKGRIIVQAKPRLATAGSLAEKCGLVGGDKVAVDEARRGDCDRGGTRSVVLRDAQKPRRRPQIPGDYRGFRRCQGEQTGSNQSGREAQFSQHVKFTFLTERESPKLANARWIVWFEARYRCSAC